MSAANAGPPIANATAAVPLKIDERMVAPSLRRDHTNHQRNESQANTRRDEAVWLASHRSRKKAPIWSVSGGSGHRPFMSPRPGGASSAGLLEAAQYASL